MKIAETFIASLLCAFTIAPAAAQAPATRKVIDFACVKAMTAAPCGMTKPITVLNTTVPAVPRTLDLANGQETSAYPGFPPTPGDVGAVCIALLIANPPDACVSDMYSSADVNKLLAEQEVRARKRERALCLAIARDANICPALIVN